MTVHFPIYSTHGPRKTHGDKLATDLHRTRIRAVRFPGLVAFCREQEVDRTHAYRVLSGERQSRRLLLRFRDWLKGQGMPWPATAVRPPKGRTPNA